MQLDIHTLALAIQDAKSECRTARPEYYLMAQRHLDSLRMAFRLVTHTEDDKREYKNLLNSAMIPGNSNSALRPTQ